MTKKSQGVRQREKAAGALTELFTQYQVGNYYFLFKNYLNYLKGRAGPSKRYTGANLQVRT